MDTSASSKHIKVHCSIGCMHTWTIFTISFPSRLACTIKWPIDVGAICIQIAIVCVIAGTFVDICDKKMNEGAIHSNSFEIFIYDEITLMTHHIKGIKWRIKEVLRNKINCRNIGFMHTWTTFTISYPSRFARTIKWVIDVNAICIQITIVCVIARTFIDIYDKKMKGVIYWMTHHIVWVNWGV